MGSTVCTNCMSKQGEKQEVAVPNRSVKDFNVQSLSLQLSDTREDFLSLVTEGLVGNDEIIFAERVNCIVTGKDTSSGFLVKYQWTAPVSPENLISFINKPENKLKFDESIESCELLLTLPGNIEILKTIYKERLGISRRETLTASKTDVLDSGVATYSVSVDNPNFPPSEDTIRINVKVAGFYAEQLGSHCKVTSASITDLKLNAVLSKISRALTASLVPKLTNSINRKLV